LPQLSIDSLAVTIILPKGDKKFARYVFKELLKLDKPILGILREGNLLFDVLTIFEEDIPFIAKTVNSIMSKKMKTE
ncbi:MAG: hypothetical protein KAT74_05950, partial [Candidatus Cloacimonetes bacterium]|nr:hypothetical protein [Candidatus Cloacimonadota bacterium]